MKGPHGDKSPSPPLGFHHKCGPNLALFESSFVKVEICKLFGIQNFWKQLILFWREPSSSSAHFEFKHLRHNKFTMRTYVVEVCVESAVLPKLQQSSKMAPMNGNIISIELQSDASCITDRPSFVKSPLSSLVNPGFVKTFQTPGRIRCF